MKEAYLIHLENLFEQLEPEKIPQTNVIEYLIACLQGFCQSTDVRDNPKVVSQLMYSPGRQHSDPPQDSPS